MIGIFGGTFDPIHYGHLRAARDVVETLGLAAIRFLPAANPPHRRTPHAPAEDRLAMVRLALSGESGFVADDRELRRGGPSYTVLSLQELRAELGAEPLCLVIGADAFSELDTWYEWRRIPQLAHLAVMARPGASVTADPATWPAWARTRACASAAALAHASAGGVRFVAVRPQDMSATRVRADIAAGRPVTEVVPPAVWQYIQRKGLYRQAGE